MEKGGRGQSDCWVWYLKFNSKSTPRNLDNHPQFGANSELRTVFLERRSQKGVSVTKCNFRIGFKPIKLLLSEIF